MKRKSISGGYDLEYRFPITYKCKYRNSDLIIWLPLASPVKLKEELRYFANLSEFLRAICGHNTERITSRSWVTDVT